MSWERTAYVGQKVTRVKGPASGIRSDGLAKLPPLNEVITISWIDVPELSLFPGLILLDFVEYPQPQTAWYMRGIYSRMFRPVEDLTTSYDVLARLQNPNNHREHSDKFDDIHISKVVS